MRFIQAEFLLIQLITGWVHPRWSYNICKSHSKSNENESKQSKRNEYWPEWLTSLSEYAMNISDTFQKIGFAIRQKL